jgi:hypothetical protein
MRSLIICLCVIVLSIPCLSQPGKVKADPVWTLDNLSSIGGYPVSVLSLPVVKKFPEGKAIEFDGIDDGLMVNGCPINKDTAFTIEIVFKPYASYPNNAAQRFLHVQKPFGGNRRILLELRLTDKNEWYVDTHITSDTSKLTLLAKDFPHPVDRWYHLAFVYGNGTASHYVDGVKEMSGHVTYIPVDSAQVSLGMRMTKEYYFKGAIRTVRLTPRALAPSEFLK